MSSFMILSAFTAYDINFWAENNLDIRSEEVSTSEFYLKTQTVTELQISSRLTPEALLLIAKMVVNSPSLVTLEVHRTDIEKSFVNALAKSNLTSLYIFCDNIGNDAKALGSALAEFKSLTTLSIEMPYSRWSDSYALDVVKELIFSPNLQTFTNYQTLFNQVKGEQAGLKIIIEHDLDKVLPTEIVSRVTDYSSYHQGSIDEVVYTSEASSALRTFLHPSERNIVVEYLGNVLEDTDE